MANLDFILAGYERGGTTLLSEVFRANGYESGFECGVLMVDEPRNMPNFNPYWEMLPNWWKITEQTRADAATGDFSYFYDTICLIPDDHISPRRSALLMARSVLRDIRDGARAC